MIPASVFPASLFILLQSISSLSSSHMHLLKRLPNKPCCFMPFSSAHAILSMCYLSFKSLLSEALLIHMTAPLLECLLYYCNYLFLKKSHPKGFLIWGCSWKGCPWINGRKSQNTLKLFANFHVWAYFWKIL